MPFDDPEPRSLKGSLILADPSLHDPNFFRSVLLLTEHRHDHGAHGYILNRPLGKLVGDLLPSGDFGTLCDVPIFVGGPVSPEHLTFASFRWKPKSREILWATHLSTQDALDRLESGESVRAFIGYSGWGEGQLENELRQRAWIPRKPSSTVLRLEKTEHLWAALLRDMGPWYRLLADTPENPSLN
ncbi:MAG: YqgE/AlgH family protein [Verrucomicrobiales bacterium]|nr:YqgE/AlgH family protein [Verrucomicrobiales bacterium]